VFRQLEQSNDSLKVIVAGEKLKEDLEVMWHKVRNM
jgi:hypothetical protein